MQHRNFKKTWYFLLPVPARVATVVGRQVAVGVQLAGDGRRAHGHQHARLQHVHRGDVLVERQRASAPVKRRQAAVAGEKLCGDAAAAGAETGARRRRGAVGAHVALQEGAAALIAACDCA
jgi:hypothetical protein